jgi:quercetin dioxygenase-like cupin family protein
VLSIVILAIAAIIPPPLVPGGCTAPAAEHVNEAGCYLLAEMKAANLPSHVYWHISEFPTLPDAETEAVRHRWSRAVSAHGKTWLYVMGPRNEAVRGGKLKIVIGPMNVPLGGSVSIRFLTSTFPPGMRTRVHSHPGSEAFFVLEGEQCVETPTFRRRIAAGRSYVVQDGLHMQAAAQGRKSLVALILRPDAEWSHPEPGWTPSSFCKN